MVPVLNALGGLVPEVTAILRTTVPASFFQDRLTIPWTLSPAQQDVGCIQDGPLTIDIEATWEAHQHFHETWEARLSIEVAAMQAASPALIIADTPYPRSCVGILLITLWICRAFACALTAG